MSNNEFPKDGPSSQNGTTYGYTVEVKLKDDMKDPVILGETDAVGHNWKRIQAPSDFPSDFFVDGMSRTGMLEYNAAQAHRWLFLHSCGINRIALTTRLVEHEITYSHNTKAIGETAIEDGTFLRQHND